MVLLILFLTEIDLLINEIRPYDYGAMSYE